MYFKQLKNRIVNNSGIPAIDTMFNQAMLQAKKNAGFRENEILSDIRSIEIERHDYPHCRYITADVYSEENSFQFIINAEDSDGNTLYKPGDITG